ncbi:MAG: hypothetical protein H7Z14_01940 [Anaerolineae bacterium]|nr:hypothetical protein [Phycisphaerae bacterium]
MRRTPVKAIAKHSSFMRIALLGWFALAIGAMLALRSLDIGLGQGSFAYRYSEMQSQRMLRAFWLAPIAATVVLSITWSAKRRKIAPIVAITAVILLSVWTFFAPIKAVTQHSFNLRSPSHDGAFVDELYGMTTLREYLRDFDQRIQRTPAELRGTRVISNPPGTTILFYAVAYVWRPNVESPGWLERILQRYYDVNEPDALVTTMVTVQIAMLLTVLWSLAAIVWYRVARMFLSPASAMLCVLIAWFNPSTAHFVPGKDPAHLLTVGLMAWTWLAAWKRDKPTLAALSGAVLIVGATIGLIHVWVAAALVVACAWDSLARRESATHFVLRLLLPFAAGGFAILIAIYLITDWNLAKTFFTVWRRFSQIQRELALDHTIWFVIGIPLFLLFVSPALFLFGGSAIRRRRPMNFGARLSVVTVLIMATSYVVGVTYELPRLWVVFVPLLTLGLMTASPFRHLNHEGRALRAAIFIAIAHIAFTAAHWSLLDARESEHRLSGPAPTFFGKT